MLWPLGPLESIESMISSACENVRSGDVPLRGLYNLRCLAFAFSLVTIREAFKLANVCVSNYCCFAEAGNLAGSIWHT